MPEKEYRRLKRREQQLIRAVNYVGNAWRVLKDIKAENNDSSLKQEK